MTYVVAFDGTDLAEAALERAAGLAGGTGERLVVVSVVPTDRPLAEEYGLPEGGEYDPEAAARRLRGRARDVAPDAEFRAVRVDPYASKGRIATKIRAVADETDADVVVVGSDDAGRVVEPVSSVGGAVAGGADYDVLIVRSR